MIFIDDIDLNDLYEKKKLQIILVDHHWITPKQFNEIVVEIIDHRTVKAGAIDLKEYVTIFVSSNQNSSFFVLFC